MAATSDVGGLEPHRRYDVALQNRQRRFRWVIGHRIESAHRLLECLHLPWDEVESVCEKKVTVELPAASMEAARPPEAAGIAVDLYRKAMTQPWAFLLCGVPDQPPARQLRSPR